MGMDAKTKQNKAVTKKIHKLCVPYIWSNNWHIFQNKQCYIYTSMFKQGIHPLLGVPYLGLQARKWSYIYTLGGLDILIDAIHIGDNYTVNVEDKNSEDANF